MFPALFVVVFFFVGGLALSAANSLPLATYAAVFASREFQAALVLTLFVSVVSTALSAVCGLALAILLHRAARRSVWLKTLLQIPLAIPHLAAAYVLLNLFAPSGLIARFFVTNPADFPVLAGDGYGAGIIAAYVLKETPFVALVVLGVLARTGDELETVARNLGARPWQRFRFVTLPTIAPALSFASLIVFAFVFGAFEIPFVLGRQFPAMLAIVGNRKFFSTDLAERPEAFALAILMTAAAGVFVWLYLRLIERDSQTEKTSMF